MLYSIIICLYTAISLFTSLFTLIYSLSHQLLHSLNSKRNPSATPTNNRTHAYTHTHSHTPPSRSERKSASVRAGERVGRVVSFFFFSLRRTTEKRGTRKKATCTCRWNVGCILLLCSSYGGGVCMCLSFFRSGSLSKIGSESILYMPLNRFIRIIHPVSLSILSYFVLFCR